MYIYIYTRLLFRNFVYVVFPRQDDQTSSTIGVVSITNTSVVASYCMSINRTRQQHRGKFVSDRAKSHTAFCTVKRTCHCY